MLFVRNLTPDSTKFKTIFPLNFRSFLYDRRNINKEHLPENF